VKVAVGSSSISPPTMKSGPPSAFRLLAATDVCSPRSTPSKGLAGPVRAEKAGTRRVEAVIETLLHGVIAPANTEV
jgi:hypothetical protein